MSHIRESENKKTELALVAFFRRNHIMGWRRKQKVFGKPDFIFRGNRLAIFVVGCFWHACSKHGNIPVNNRIFWEEKLAANKARDHTVSRKLREEGWRVLRIWEHELKPRNEKRLLDRLRRYLLVESN